MNLTLNQHNNFTRCNSSLNGHNTSCTQSTDILTQQRGVMSTFDAVIVTILFVIMVCGFLGNSYVIYMLVVKKKRVKSWFEKRILLLAFIDLLSSLYVPGLFLYGTITRFERWHFGDIGCKIMVSLFPVTVTLSQGVLVCISYERYQHISVPQPTNTKAFPYCLTVVILMAFALVSPYTYSLGGNHNSCSTQKRSLHLVYVVGNVMRDFVAMALMCFWSLKTIRVLKESDHRLKRSREGNNNRRTSRQVTRMLTVMIVTFTLCVAPVDLFQCIILLVSENLINLHVINTLLATLQISNSVINVLIYSRMHKDLKINCCKKKILKGENKQSEVRQTLYVVYSSIRSSDCAM